MARTRYDGEWKDDMKWGFGKAEYRKKAHYEGHFFKDKRHGFGRMWYANAGTYEVCAHYTCICANISQYLLDDKKQCGAFLLLFYDRIYTWSTPTTGWTIEMARCNTYGHV